MQWKLRRDGKRTIVSIVPDGPLTALHIQTNAGGVSFDLLAVGEKRVMETLASGRLPKTAPDGWVVLQFEHAVDAKGLELILGDADAAVDAVASAHAVEIGPLSPNLFWVGLGTWVAAAAAGAWQRRREKKTEASS